MLSIYNHIGLQLHHHHPHWAWDCSCPWHQGDALWHRSSFQEKSCDIYIYYNCILNRGGMRFHNKVQNCSAIYFILFQSNPASKKIESDISFRRDSAWSAPMWQTLGDSAQTSKFDHCLFQTLQAGCVNQIECEVNARKLGKVPFSVPGCKARTCKTPNDCNTLITAEHEPTAISALITEMAKFFTVCTQAKVQILMLKDYSGKSFRSFT